MDLQLPRPIDCYIRAENSRDVDAMSQCFAPYATVRDADEYIEGRPAIKAWKVASQEKNITPLAIDVADGEATLKARLSGKFRGSPLTADFLFKLVNDQIVSLHIRC